MRSAAVMVLLAISILAAACASNALALEAKDDGRKVKIEKGQTLVIALKSNPSTGYLWEAVELDETVLQQKGEAKFKAQSKLVGAPGVQTFRFEARSTGQTTLRLVHHRPWEKDKAPLETFTVQVTVR